MMEMNKSKMSFQVLIVTSKKMAAFWDIALHNLVEIH
jgi:hypothetical protein